MERWSGKVAVVTGASVGIGAAITRELLQNGLIVVGLARRKEKIEEIGATTENNTGKLYAIECDVSKEDSIVSAFIWIKENLGNINILINNAGMMKEATLIDGTIDEWRAVFDVNVLGVCVCSREAVKLMKDTNDEGMIVVINSLAGDRVPPVPGFGVYPASKRAVSAIAHTLRHELTGTKTRVTTITPGLVSTEFMTTFTIFSQEVLSTMPSLQPQDVASAVIYALSTPGHVSVQDIVLRPVGETW